MGACVRGYGLVGGCQKEGLEAEEAAGEEIRKARADMMRQRVRVRLRMCSRGCWRVDAVGVHARIQHARAGVFGFMQVQAFVQF